MENNLVESKEVVITAVELLEHWQGHRKLTRRVIEAFPEKEFFSFSIGGMRPFSELLIEIMDISRLGIKGLVYGEWKPLEHVEETSKQEPPRSKEEFLRQWDEITDAIDQHWGNLRIERFHEVEAAFGQYENTIISSLFYFIDNEIHHRGQSYVYLRALGIEPPPFWDR